MTDDPKPPVLGDSVRPPVPERIKRWLAEADKLRAEREAGIADSTVGTSTEKPA